MVPAGGVAFGSGAERVEIGVREVGIGARVAVIVRHRRPRVLGDHRPRVRDVRSIPRIDRRGTNCARPLATPLGANAGLGSRSAALLRHRPRCLLRRGGGLRGALRGGRGRTHRGPCTGRFEVVAPVHVSTCASLLSKPEAKHHDQGEQRSGEHGSTKSTVRTSPRIAQRAEMPPRDVSPREMRRPFAHLPGWPLSACKLRTPYTPRCHPCDLPAQGRRSHLRVGERRMADSRPHQLTVNRRAGRSARCPEHLPARHGGRSYAGSARSTVPRPRPPSIRRGHRSGSERRDRSG